MKDTALKEVLMAHSLYEVCDDINTPQGDIDPIYMLLVSQENSKNLKLV